jgi:AmmeMemoRadiSam system protein B
MHGSCRLPAVAGQFYPGDPTQLEGLVRDLLGAARRLEPYRGRSPKALIAPHAGFVYSGPIAASAYATLAAERDSIERIVLLGPSHRVAFRGLAAPSSDAFRTPLGDVPIDREAIDRVASLPQVSIDDRAHALEHSLEVQLPFLQIVLGDFALAPFAVGDATADEVAEVLDRLWGGPETRIVVSSDLSHYYDYATARRMDAAASHAIEQLDPSGLGRESACGRVPIRGLLVEARRRRLKAKTIDLRSSGDTAGPRDEVVGYGAYALD